MLGFIFKKKPKTTNLTCVIGASININNIKIVDHNTNRCFLYQGIGDIWCVQTIIKFCFGIHIYFL